MSGSLEFPSFEDLAPDDFLQKLERIRTLYREIGLALDVRESINDHQREKSRGRDPISYDEWEHCIYDDERDDLEECSGLRAQFVIVFIAGAVRDLWYEIQRELRLDPKKGRDNFLEPLRTALRELQIDVVARPEWPYIEDVVNARNTIMHRGARGNSRYIDGQGEVLLSSTDLDQLLDNLHQFRDWLRKEVRECRSGGTR